LFTFLVTQMLGIHAASQAVWGLELQPGDVVTTFWSDLAVYRSGSCCGFLPGPPGYEPLTIEGAAIDADRRIVAVGWNYEQGTAVFRVDPRTGSADVLASGLGYWDVEIAPEGTLLVASGDATLELDPADGTVLRVLSYLFDPTLAPDGALVGIRYPEGLLRVDRVTGDETVWASGPSFGFVTSLPQGDVMALSFPDSAPFVRVHRFDPQSGAETAAVDLPWIGQSDYVTSVVAESEQVLLMGVGYICRTGCGPPGSARVDANTGALLAGGVPGSALAVVRPRCSDTFDDDRDGEADAGQDPGCSGPEDDSEHEATLPCDNGEDDDGDGRADFRMDGTGDPGCGSSWGREHPECQDGRDNDLASGIDFDGGASLDLDGDGFIDSRFNPATPAVGAADPQCVGMPWSNKERSGCGLGFELVLLAPLLARFTRSRRA
jgi:hypothetical protein